MVRPGSAQQRNAKGCHSWSEAGFSFRCGRVLVWCTAVKFTQLPRRACRPAVDQQRRHWQGSRALTAPSPNSQLREDPQPFPEHWRLPAPAGVQGAIAAAAAAEAEAVATREAIAHPMQARTRTPHPALPCSALLLAPCCCTNSFGAAGQRALHVARIRTAQPCSLRAPACTPRPPRVGRCTQMALGRCWRAMLRWTPGSSTW
jgi:hypothetical protein